MFETAVQRREPEVVATPSATGPAGHHETAAPSARGPGLSGDLLAALLDAMDAGVLLCDAQARVRFMNQAGWRCVRRDDALSLGDDDRLADAALREAVAQCARSQRRQLRPLGPSGTLVYLLPLARPIDGDAGVAVLLGRCSEGADLAIEMLGMTAGLTASERGVLRSLVRGCQPAHVARERRVALSTVRTQIATVRAKLRVDSIVGLIGLVAALPPILPAWPAGEAPRSAAGRAWRAGSAPPSA